MSNTGMELRRAHYLGLYESLLDLPADELRRRKQASDRTFLDQGITFTASREEGTERIFPHDLLPRITAQEWSTIERGLIQRINAEFLLLNQEFPHSVRFCVERFNSALTEIDDVDSQTQRLERAASGAPTLALARSGAADTGSFQRRRKK